MTDTANTSLELGDRAPNFDLAVDGGGRARLADYVGRKVVLYFYPKDDTTGCTKEAQGFSDHAADFAKAGAVVVGVSKDSIKSHEKFKAKYDLNVVLASDPEGEMIERYGAWIEKSMYGRKYMGIDRSTFLIGPDGRVVQVWRSVKVPGHVEAVLKAAQAL